LRRRLGLFTNGKDLDGIEKVGHVFKLRHPCCSSFIVITRYISVRAIMPTNLAPAVVYVRFLSQAWHLRTIFIDEYSFHIASFLVKSEAWGRGV